MSQSKYRQRMRDRRGTPDGGGVDASFVPTQTGRVTIQQQRQMENKTPPPQPPEPKQQLEPTQAGDVPPVGVGRSFEDEQRLMEQEADFKAKQQEAAQEEMQAANAANEAAEAKLAEAAQTGTQPEPTPEPVAEEESTEETPQPEAAPEPVNEDDGDDAEEGDENPKGD